MNFRCQRGFQGKRCEKRSSIPPAPTDHWQVTKAPDVLKGNSMPREDLGEFVLAFLL